MSNEKHSECEICTLIQRIFGEKCDGCATLTRIMGDEAINLLIKKREEFLLEIQNVHAAHEITEKEAQTLTEHVEKSFVFASANIPVLALVNGGKSDPMEMGNMVLMHMQTLTIQSRLADLMKILEESSRINTPPPKSKNPKAVN